MNKQTSEASVRLGRDLLFDMLTAYDIPYVFGNPGTSELPFIDGAEQYGHIEYISALHEANAVSMAMGYARQSRKPGVAIVHVAPGLANAMGNIYNAYRAGIPLVIIAGQHHSEWLLGEPILAGDHVKQVESMTKWAHEIRNMAEYPVAMQRAFKVAMTEPKGPVFLSAPYNLSLTPTEARIGKPELFEQAVSVSGSAVKLFLEKLLSHERILLISGDQVGDQQAVGLLQEWAELLGAPVMAEGMPTRQNIDSAHPQYLGTFPMNAGVIRQVYAECDALVMVGTTVQLPAALSDGQGFLVDDRKPVFYIQQDAWEIAKNPGLAYGLQGSVHGLLQQLVEATSGLLTDALQQVVRERRSKTEEAAARRRQSLQVQLEQDWEVERITASVLAAELNRQLATLPAGRFTLVNEAVSNAGAFIQYMHLWEPQQYTAGKGGGLGHGVGQALGIKLADPERTVVCAVGDGTFLYYPQILYSAVTYDIPVLFLIVQNEAYRVLKQGLQAMGEPLGHKVIPSLELAGAVHMMKLAEAFGVAGETVQDREALAPALERALAKSRKQPYMLEVYVK
ncbi:thiamine pyrophosphate-binding protein [Paenibacillus sanguinis]|uniref:thiamine pyrophosphate-binding protein n=1 Tax=Paenibacillus sanguinis TaxID=225906 RepID=UPI000360F155|nr:thiamine pyrophosphate-binding protein [Paenibacillus sanguinis]